MNDCSVYLRQRSSALDSVASSSTSTAGRSRTCVGQHGTSRQRGVSTGPARLSTGSARGQHGVSTGPAHGQHAVSTRPTARGVDTVSAGTVHCVCASPSRGCGVQACPMHSLPVKRAAGGAQEHDHATLRGVSACLGSDQRTALAPAAGSRRAAAIRPTRAPTRPHCFALARAPDAPPGSARRTARQVL